MPTAKDVVAKLHQSVTTQQRLAILEQVKFRLESCMERPQLCNTMLGSGIINALCLQLGFVLNRKESTKKEVECICQVISIIYRNAEAKDRDSSISMIGLELFNLLLKAISWSVRFPILSIFHLASGTSQGTTTLFKTSKLLSSLVDILEEEFIESDNLMEILGILKNLSYFGEDHRLQIVECPGLIAQLCGQVCKKKDEERLSEKFSAILRNLAVSPCTRKAMVRQSMLLNAIIQMGSHSNKQITRNILNCCVSLGQDAESCSVISLHGDGIFWNLMKRYMMNETDSTIRKRSARVVRLLASASAACSHDKVLIKALSHRALNDISNDVRTEATDALVKLSESVAAPMPHHELILDALTHLASSPTAILETLASAIKMQASHPSNRSVMAERKMLLQSVARIALSSEATNACKEDACRAILYLSELESNRAKIVSTNSILEALVQNSSGRYHIEEQDKRQLYAIQTLVKLASTSSNRKMMASYNRLLQTLVQYASSSPPGDTKADVKRVILWLVSEL